MGREIFVTVHEKKVVREDHADNYSNLYVGNLPKEFSEEQLEELFSEFGEIQKLKFDTEKACGFVKFRSHESALAAVDKLNLKHQINGQAITVTKHISQNLNNMARDEPPITQSMKNMFEANIFIRNIPKTVTEDDFRKEMAKAGEIKTIKLEDFKQTDRSTGETYFKFKKGYVNYMDVKQAQKCIQLFHQATPFGYGTPLHVDFWQSKHDQNKQKKEKDDANVVDMIKLINFEL